MDTWEVTFDEKPQIDNQNGQSRNSPANGTNVGKVERIASGILGGALIGYGIKKHSKGSVPLALFGAGLLYRGATGHCEAYERLGVNTAGGEDVARDFHVEKSITILRTPEELYKFWKDPENFPRFMENLESVTQLDETRSHWVVKGPGSTNVEWDAEIFNEKENELIAWRSLSHADVTNAGSVHFEETRGRGTRVKVTLNYNAPGGKIGVLFAKLFGAEPGQLIEHNLKRLKQLLEAGEIPTIEGQPSGRLPETSRGDRKANKVAKAATKASSLAQEEVA